MPTIVVTFRGSKATARTVVKQMLQSVVGRSSEYADLAAGVHAAVAVAAQSDVKDDFVRKSEGQMGEDGVKWPDLKPDTIARRGKVTKADEREVVEIGARAALVRGIAKGKRKKLAKKHGAARAKKMAIVAAEREATRLTGVRKRDVLALRKVQMLRDKGGLFNSLSPGTATPTGFVNGGKNQSHVTTPNGIKVTSNVEYAPRQNFGGAPVPARQFVPEEPPQAWVDGWKEAGAIALAKATQLALERSGGAT